MTEMNAYRDSLEHLFDELRRLDLVLNLHVARRRREAARSTSGFDEFRGLFISEEEIDELVGDGRGAAGQPHEAPDEDTCALSLAILELEERTAERVAVSEREGVTLRLPELTRLFSLSDFDRNVLVTLCAPELELKYEKLYAYLQDDVTRKRPSANLILNLFCPTLAAKLEARARLGRSAPLLEHRLVRFADEAQAETATFLSRALRIDERILQFILGTEALDEQLASFVSVKQARAAWSDVMLPAETKESLMRVFAGVQGGQKTGAGGQKTGADGERGDQSADRSDDRSDGRATARLFIFEGAAGVGKRTTAEALCAAHHMELLVADLSRLPAGAETVSLLPRLLREARLRSAAIYFDHAEQLLSEHEREATQTARAALARALAEFQGLAFIGSTQPLKEGFDVAAEQIFRINLPSPDYRLRREIWNAFLSAERVLPEVEREALADKFAFTAGKIYAAIAEARHLSVMRDGQSAELSNEDLYRACRSQSSQRLAGLARKITPLYTWRDLVLPAGRIEHLREVCAHVRHRQRVFGEWGFQRKLALGRGLSVLFVGQSGTGKTMASEIIAGELGLDLYKIDLSSVVSKYIGETEKNLSRIFEEAEQSNAVLFFDEADAIFGKRSEVKDSHDRYANIETNYLLQRMEEYEGIVILASNFQKNIDEAFTRRIRFVIDFPFPDDAYRQHIWRKVFPETTPLDADVDFDFLAQKLKLSGGQIKNIALNAAFLAARNGGRVHMEHLICATKREFQKTGRLCVRADFDHYFEYVERESEEAEVML